MENKEKSSGIGCFAVLGFIFVILKLTRYIDWSWRWVILPFFIPTLIWLIVILFLLFRLRLYPAIRNKLFKR